ncbi:MAG TPA: Stp1/IreP family PP2C-type Ser/Thr phosphatase [Acidimicrobiia bacterium]|nr:Stp1/IreP family PP2C-type Ser/Thr phosphatase [Acidimicrobiia bacterium]
MRFASGARTDVGRGRPENEDSILVDAAHGLYAVADGMGGHRAGEVASATAIETLKAAYVGGQRLDDAVEAANAAVFAKAADDQALQGMGTTLTAVALEDDHTALLGHVGDSRAYLMRDGAVTQVTDDHSLVEQLVREGRLSPEEAQNHPQRAIITRALGIDAEVEVDTYRVDLKPGDRLLICSDGLTTMLSDDTIAVTLRRHPDPQQAADTLVDMANQAGGDDNITVVILDALADGTGGAADAVAASEPVAAAGEPEPVATAGEPELHEPSAEEPSPLRVEAPPRRSLRGVLLWALPILAVIGIGVGAVGWYARRTYFVGLSADRVTLFKGVPGGLLGWQPTVDRRTDLTAADLAPADRDDVEKARHRFTSRSDADRFLARLQQAHEALAGTTTTTTGAAVEGPATTATTETTR